MPEKENKNIIALAVNLSTFSAAFMSSAINIILPTIGREFQVNTIMLGWIVTAYLLTMAMLLVPLGKLADIYGRKKFFFYGLILYTLSSLFGSLSPSAVLLLCFRVFQGMGGAAIIVTGMAILTSVFPPGERGRVLGINTAMTYLGLSTAPALGGILTQYLGWRSVFLANLPLCLLVIILVFWKVKGEWTEALGEKMDLTGSLIYGFSLVSLIYGLTLVPQLRGIWFIAPAMAGIVVFIYWEMRIKNPILDIRLFTQNRVFALSNLAALTNYSATFALGFLLSLYLQNIKGLDPQNAGFVLISQPAVMALASPLAGKLSEKIEPRILASCGMAVVVVGLISLLFITEGTSMLLIVACLMLLGSGFALFSSPNMNAIMSSVPKNFYGVASATLATMRLTGQLLSMAIVMVIFTLKMGQVQVAPEHSSLFLSSMKTVFIIFALLCTGGILASLSRGKMKDAAQNALHPPS